MKNVKSICTIVILSVLFVLVIFAIPVIPGVLTMGDRTVAYADYGEPNVVDPNVAYNPILSGSVDSTAFRIKAWFGNDRIRYGAISTGETLPFTVTIDANDPNWFMDVLPTLQIRDTIKVYENSSYIDTRNFEFGVTTTNPGQTYTVAAPSSSPITYTPALCFTCTGIDPNIYSPVSLALNLTPKMSKRNIRVGYMGKDFYTANLLVSPPLPYWFSYELNPGMSIGSGSYSIRTQQAGLNYAEIFPQNYAYPPDCNDKVSSVKFCINNLLGTYRIPVLYSQGSNPPTGTPNKYILNYLKDYIVVVEYRILYKGNNVPWGNAANSEWRYAVIPLLNLFNNKYQTNYYMYGFDSSSLNSSVKNLQWGPPTTNSGN